MKTEMRKLTLTVLLMTSLSPFYAQRYGVIYDKLEKVIQQKNIDNSPVPDDLTGKKFVSTDNNLKKIIHFEEQNKVMLMEIREENPQEKTFNVYTGDMVKNDNRISVRADHLEGKRIAIPYTVNFIVQKNGNTLFLIDISNNKKWLPAAP